MKKLLLLLLLSLGFTISAYADSSDFHYKCKTGFFTSSEIDKIGEDYFLDGLKYPEVTEKLNSEWSVWATIREVNSKDDNLLLTTSQTTKRRPVSLIESFEINLKDLSFTKYHRSTTTGRLSNKIAQKFRNWGWGRNSTGKCKMNQKNGMGIFYTYVFFYLALGFGAFRAIKKGEDGYLILFLVIAFVLATVWLFVFINTIFGNTSSW